MWQTLYIILIGFAILMLLLSIIKENNPFWNITGALLSSVTFLILSLSGMQIEIPYTAIQSDNTIVTGTHTYTSPISPYLTYFFLLLFILIFIYFLAMIWDKWYNYKNWHGGY